MAFIPVPDVALVTVEGIIIDQQFIMTFYYKWIAGSISSADLADLTSNLVVTATTEFPPVLPNTVLLQRIVATDLTTNPGLQELTLFAPGVDGANASTMPGSICLSIKRASAFVGRSRRGRVYWPLWDDAISNTAPNQSSLTIAADIISAIEAFDASAFGLDWQPVIVSRQQGGVPLVTGQAYPIVGWSVADINVDSQRRRLAGRGA